MNNKVAMMKQEIGKAIIGKEAVIEKILAAILAEGHILLDDIPGVGKTTLALAFTKTMGLAFKRVQFTPDVVPSDITGFSMYDKQSGTFQYNPGQRCVIFSWQTKSIVRPARPSQRCWKLWRKDE